MPTEILDPSCGQGALLVAAVETLRRAGSTERLVLHGVEIDPERAVRAGQRLAALARADGGLEVHVECRDALDPDFPWPGGAVVANPPWASLSGRQAVSLPAGVLERYRQAWAALQGWPSLHGAFLERIARHCNSARVRARVLMPASVCSLPGYGRMRAVVAEFADLVGAPEELGERAFPGVLEPAALLTLRARTSRVAPTQRPWELLGPEAAAVLDRMRRFPRLDAACFADPGVHTGNAAALLVERSAPRDWPGLREGRDLRAFELAAPRLGLRTDVAPEVGRRFRVQPLERYAAVPLLLRQTANRPIAALHTRPTYFRNSLLACLPPPGLDPAFCAAVLNGPGAAQWHRLRFADARQRTFPQVKVGHLRSQPFPITHRDEDPELHDGIVDAVRNLSPGTPGFDERAQALGERVERAFAAC